MTAPKPITIIGGGLAGLSLGIALRRRGVPVMLWETGQYPRHRVCGEFVCGRGLAVLERLGLRDALMKAGAIPARNAAFFFGRAASPLRAVEPAALCLSRYRLDAVLAREFVSSGGDLRLRSPWRDPTPREAVVRATGRRVQPVHQGWRWFGLKIHARNVGLSADLEMHCLPNQYIGVSRIEEDKVNICGLFRRRVREVSIGRLTRELLLGPPGSLLRQRLKDAVLDGASFCAVAGLPLQPQLAASQVECVIGDALTMIPPVTGNGMSMALEAAALAAGPIEAFSRCEASWLETRRSIATACDRLFSSRLRWAGWFQHFLFSGWMQRKPGWLLLRSDSLWRLLFARTR